MPQKAYWETLPINRGDLSRFIKNKIWRILKCQNVLSLKEDIHVKFAEEGKM